MWNLGHRHQRILLMPQRAPSADEDPEPRWYWVHCVDQQSLDRGSAANVQSLSCLDQALPCCLVIPPQSVTLVTLDGALAEEVASRESLDELVERELCVVPHTLALHVLYRDDSALDVMVVQRTLLAQCSRRLGRHHLSPRWWASAFQGLPPPEPDTLGVLPWGDDWMLKWRHPETPERERWLCWPKSQDMEDLSDLLPEVLRESPWNCPLAPQAVNGLDCLDFCARHLPEDLPLVPSDIGGGGQPRQREAEPV